MPTFVQLKRTVKRMHRDMGRPISDAEAHSITRSALMSQLAEEFTRAAEAYSLDYADPTGEQATDNHLIRVLAARAGLGKEARSAV